MRGLIGLRSELLTLTRGYGIMSHLSAGYGPHKGDIAPRNRGVLVASSRPGHRLRPAQPARPRDPSSNPVKKSTWASWW